ncbi:MAG: iron dependent repressor, metal binding and dimerization domain protein [Chloroflexota bacterium]
MTVPLISLLTTLVLIVLGVLFFRAQNGLFWRWQRNRRRTERVLQEDALKHICQGELDGGRSNPTSLAGALGLNVAAVTHIISDLQARGLLELDGNDLNLSSNGRDVALRIIRAHRLYERYLSEESGYSEEEWHRRAHDREHMLSAEDLAALSQRLGNPTHDPHGDPIPAADGSMHLFEKTMALASLAPDTPARITHLEDEPETVYAQLVAEGLMVGQKIRLLEAGPQRVRFWADGDEHVLAPILAANIGVVPILEAIEQTPPGQPLSSLEPGQERRVLSLSPRLRGVERRRLMDLGLMPGTLVSVEMVSVGGDPTAYRIRGALIALRRNQTDQIFVTGETVTSTP